MQFGNELYKWVMKIDESVMKITPVMQAWTAFYVYLIELKNKVQF